MGLAHSSSKTIERILLKQEEQSQDQHTQEHEHEQEQSHSSSNTCTYSASLSCNAPIRSTIECSLCTSSSQQQQQQHQQEVMPIFHSNTNDFKNNVSSLFENINEIQFCFQKKQNVSHGFALACASYKQAVQLLGTLDLNTLVIQHLILLGVLLLGKKEEQWLVDALDGYKQSSHVLGMNHPQVLSTQHNVICLLLRHRNFVQAISWAQDCYERRFRCFGKHDHRTFATLRLWIYILILSGRHGDAFEKAEYLYALQTHVFGVLHPLTLWTQRHMLFLQLDSVEQKSSNNKQYTSQLAKEAYKHHVLVFGPYYKKTVRIQNALFLCLQHTNHVDEALVLGQDYLRKFANDSTLEKDEHYLMLQVKLLTILWHMLDEQLKQCHNDENENENTSVVNILKQILHFQKTAFLDHMNIYGVNHPKTGMIVNVLCGIVVNKIVYKNGNLKIKSDHPVCDKLVYECFEQNLQVFGTEHAYTRDIFVTYMNRMEDHKNWEECIWLVKRYGDCLLSPSASSSSSLPKYVLLSRYFYELGVYDVALEYAKQGQHTSLIQRCMDAIIERVPLQNECVVCCARERTQFFLSCGHYIMCGLCEEKCNHSCPICRIHCTSLTVGKLQLPSMIRKCSTVDVAGVVSEEEEEICTFLLLPCLHVIQQTARDYEQYMTEKEDICTDHRISDRMSVACSYTDCEYQISNQIGASHRERDAEHSICPVCQNPFLFQHRLFF